MIKVKEIMLSNSIVYTKQTKNQLKKGTGEILDFEGWNEKDSSGFRNYLENLNLSTADMNKIKLKNISELQMLKVKILLKQEREYK